MKAIILAAGFGRRMEAVSGNLHKALLPIAGSTVLGRAIDALTDRVDELVIVTGHQAHQIRGYVNELNPPMPVRFVHNPRYAETNNVVSLSLALDCMEFTDDVLIVECDLLVDAKILEPLLSAAGGNLALLDRWRLGMDGTVVTVDGGLITQVWPSHLQTADFRYDDKYKTLNIYRFDRDFCRDVFRPLLSCYANLIDGNAFYELVLGMLVNMQRHKVRAMIVDGGTWAEVDDPNDLVSASFIFEPHRRQELLARAFGGLWNFDVLDFGLIRNVHFPSDSMLATMRHALPELIGNYGSTQLVLNEKLGWFLTCDPKKVQVSAGASQVIPMLPDLVGSADVLLPAPTFGEWSRAFPHADTYQDRPGVDLDELEARAAQRRVLVVVNPNNPTGTTLPTEWIHGLAARHPDLRVIVDESFVDFCDYTPVQTLLEAEPLQNVLVVKSLGKSMGVPGLRLGYCYSPDTALVEAIGERIPVWNLSAPAEFLLELLLKHRADLARSVRQTIEDREQLRQALNELPFVAEAPPSGGNFVPVRLANATAADLVAGLLAEHGIWTKSVTGRLAEGEWLRVAVRGQADNLRIVRAMRMVVGA